MAAQIGALPSGMTESAMNAALLRCASVFWGLTLRSRRLDKRAPQMYAGQYRGPCAGLATQAAT
jgi:hypothetical protein